jgi:hypothetical protein
MVPAADEFDWPVARCGEQNINLRSVEHPTSRKREFLYVRNLPEPWCGVDDLGHQASIRMRFDTAKLPYVWLFLTYGGWRDYYTAVLEPCTNMPKDLAEAVRLGQSARIEPGKEFRTQVSVTVLPLLPNIKMAPHNTRNPAPARGGTN